MKIDPNSPADLSAQISQAIRDAIVSGDLIVDERLPSEAELADQFQVSRPTVREALKRLAAQSLIRTQRGLFYEAWSEDRGASWSKPRPTRFEAPNAPAALLRLSDGRLLMSWNDLARYPSRHDQMRQYLHVALSPDDGATWTPSVEIARREPGQLPDTQVSYPFLCENSDGSVLILYYRVGADPDQSWWTPSIEVLRLDPDWVQRATR